jgi:hypothetical protein
MARGMRGMAVGYLGLVALYGVLDAEQRGKNKPSGLLSTFTAGIRRLLDPNVAALPDYTARAERPGPLERPGGGDFTRRPERARAGSPRTVPRLGTGQPLG